MKKLFSGTALVAVLSMASPFPAASAADGNHWVEGSDHGTFTAVPLDTTHIKSTDEATGEARHIGRYTLRASEVIDLAHLDISDGRYTLITSHGTLTGRYEGSGAGTADPSVITYHVEGPVLSGSGHFTRVTGWLVFDGVGNLATGELCDHVSGWISRPGEEANGQPASRVVTPLTLPCEP